MNLFVLQGLLWRHSDKKKVLSEGSGKRVDGRGRGGGVRGGQVVYGEGGK